MCLGKGSIDVEVVKGPLAAEERAPTQRSALNDKPQKWRPSCLLPCLHHLLPDPHSRQPCVGPEVAVRAEDVAQFCAIVVNQGWSPKAARNEKFLAPRDFSTMTGWQVCRPKCPVIFLTDFRYSGYYEVYNSLQLLTVIF